MADRALNIKLTSDKAALITANKAAIASFLELEKAATKAQAAVMGRTGGGGPQNQAAQAVKEAKKAAEEQVAAVRKKVVDIEAIEDRYVAKEYQRQIQKERQAEAARQREIAQAQRAAEKKAADIEAIEQRWLAREYRERVAHMRKQEEAALASSQKVSDSMMGFMKGAGMFAAGIAGLSSITGVLHEIKGAFDTANNAARDAANFVTDYRKALLELAALKGQAGETGKTTAEEIAFRAKTLQTTEASREYNLQGLSVAESVTGAGMISKEEMQKALELGGQFQAMEGGSASTHGNLVGTLPMLMGRKNVSAEDVFREEMKLYKIFQPGRGEFTQRVDQYLQSAGEVQAGHYTAPEMAAVQSAFSLSRPESTATMAGQLTRATIGSIGRLRGSPFEAQDSDENVQKRNEYLKMIGATDQDSPIQVAEKMQAEFEASAKAREAKGEKFNLRSHLGAKGYANMGDMEVLETVYGLHKTGQWQEFMKMAEAPAPSMAEAQAPITKWQATDHEAMRRKAQIATDLGKIETGGSGMEYLRDVRTMAFANLRRGGSMPYKSVEELQSAEGGPAMALKSALRDESIRITEELLAKNNLPSQLKKVYYGGGGMGQMGHTETDYSAYGNIWDTDYTKANKGFITAGEMLARGHHEVLPGWEETQKAAVDMDKTRRVLSRIADAWEKGSTVGKPLDPAPAQAGR